jgi:hypothetical protein
VEELYSAEEWNTAEVIFEADLDLTKSKGTAKALINILQKLKVELRVEAIKNANYSKSELACLRVLEVSPNCGELTIGTDKWGHLATLQPVLENRFYDHEFGYLSQNINQE